MRNLKDATSPLKFNISMKCVKDAKRHDKNYCVIAQALRKLPGITSVEVGASTTHVAYGNKVTRYWTPSTLRVALNTFDRTGFWMLPVDRYELQVPPLSESLQSHRDYEAKRRKRLAANKGKRAHQAEPPKRKQLNPRFLEFSKMKNARTETKRSAR